jgi:hypothetical protein
MPADNTTFPARKLFAVGTLLVTAAGAGAATSLGAPAKPVPAKAPVRTPKRHRVHRHPAQRRRHHAKRASSAVTASHGYSIPISIVMCESGGNYRAVNPTSGAGGAYQILPSTWAAYGGTGLPQDAPPAEQDAIAAKIYAAGGPSQWSCA